MYFYSDRHYFYCKGQDHAAYGWAPHVSVHWTDEQEADYRRGFFDYTNGINADQRIRYEIGDSVMTPFGPGKVEGFERFDKEGNADTLSSEDDRMHRIAVALDPGHTWEHRGLCYLTHKEIVR